MLLRRRCGGAMHHGGPAQPLLRRKQIDGGGLETLCYMKLEWTSASVNAWDTAGGRAVGDVVEERALPDKLRTTYDHHRHPPYWWPPSGYPSAQGLNRRTLTRVLSGCRDDCGGLGLAVPAASD